MDKHNNTCTRLGDVVNIPGETLLNKLNNIKKQWYIDEPEDEHIALCG